MKNWAIIQSRAVEVTLMRDQYSQGQQLRALNSIIEALERIWDATLELSVLYQERNQHLNYKAVVESISNTRLATRQIRWTLQRRSHGLGQSVGDTIDMDVQVRSLREALDRLIQSVTDCVSVAMPISLSERVTKSITYEQIRLNPQSAIQHAFSLLEDHLRSKIGAGADVYGRHLINAAFGSHGCLRWGEMPNEREGVRNLMAGAYAVFRNPRMHRLMEDSETTALATISLVDLMIQIVDEAEYLDSQGEQEE